MAPAESTGFKFKERITGGGKTYILEKKVDGKKYTVSIMDTDNDGFDAHDAIKFSNGAVSVFKIEDIKAAVEKGIPGKKEDKTAYDEIDGNRSKECSFNAMPKAEKKDGEYKIKAEEDKSYTLESFMNCDKAEESTKKEGTDAAKKESAEKPADKPADKAENKAEDKAAEQKTESPNVDMRQLLAVDHSFNAGPDFKALLNSVYTDSYASTALACESSPTGGIFGSFGSFDSGFSIGMPIFGPMGGIFGGIGAMMLGGIFGGHCGRGSFSGGFLGGFLGSLLGNLFGGASDGPPAPAYQQYPQPQGTYYPNAAPATPAPTAPVNQTPTPAPAVSAPTPAPAPAAAPAQASGAQPAPAATPAPEAKSAPAPTPPVTPNPAAAPTPTPAPAPAAKPETPPVPVSSSPKAPVTPKSTPEPVDSDSPIVSGVPRKMSIGGRTGVYTLYDNGSGVNISTDIDTSGLPVVETIKQAMRAKLPENAKPTDRSAIESRARKLAARNVAYQAILKRQGVLPTFAIKAREDLEKEVLELGLYLDRDGSIITKDQIGKPVVISPAQPLSQDEFKSIMAPVDKEFKAINPQAEGADQQLSALLGKIDGIREDFFTDEQKALKAAKRREIWDSFSIAINVENKRREAKNASAPATPPAPAPVASLEPPPLQPAAPPTPAPTPAPATPAPVASPQPPASAQAAAPNRPQATGDDPFEPKAPVSSQDLHQQIIDLSNRSYLEKTAEGLQRIIDTANSILTNNSNLSDEDSNMLKRIISTAQRNLNSPNLQSAATAQKAANSKELAVFERLKQDVQNFANNKQTKDDLPSKLAEMEKAKGFVAQLKTMSKGPHNSMTAIKTPLSLKIMKIYDSLPPEQKAPWMNDMLKELNSIH